MNHQNLLSMLKNHFPLNDLHKMSDTEILLLYLKLGNIVVDYIKFNKLDKSKTLISIFNQLKIEFTQIQIHNLESFRALYQLSLDYHKLDIIKELLKQICSQNKILIIQNTNSVEEMVANIKNSINKRSYIDKYTKLYYHSQIRANGNAMVNFIETIRLLTIFKKI